MEYNSEMEKQITLYSFQTLRNDVATGMVKFLLPFYNKLSENHSVEYFISDSRDNSDRYRGIRPVSRIYFYLFKTLDVIENKFGINKILSRKRYYKEVLFDYFCASTSHNKKTIISSSYLPRTFLKNKKLGGKNFFIAGNPCEFAIRKVLYDLETRYDIQIDDVYTDPKRLEFIEESYQNIDSFILFTESQKDTFSEYVNEGNIFYKETFIMPNSSLFPPTNIKKNNDCFTFCYVAHSVWLKGLTILLEAWIESDFKDAQLLIGGTIEPSLKKVIAERFGEMKGVKFVGHIKDLNKFYRKSHACVVPSLLDAGPATIAESLYCGTPVICSDGCGSKTIVKGVYGIVTKAGDIKSLSEGMLQAKAQYENFQFSGEDFVQTYIDNNEEFFTAVSEYIFEVDQ